IARTHYRGAPPRPSAIPCPWVTAPRSAPLIGRGRQIKSGDPARQVADAPGGGTDRARPTRMALECAERLAQTGSWDWDLEPDVLLWSDNLFRLLGLEPGAITPTPEYVIEQTHPDDRPLVEAEIEAARQQGTPPDVTYRFVLPGGTIRLLRGVTTAVAPMRD